MLNLAVFLTISNSSNGYFASRSGYLFNAYRNTPVHVKIITALLSDPHLITAIGFHDINLKVAISPAGKNNVLLVWRPDCTIIIARIICQVNRLFTLRFEQEDFKIARAI